MFAMCLTAAIGQVWKINQVSHWTVYSFHYLGGKIGIGQSVLAILYRWTFTIAAIQWEPPQEAPFKNVYIRIVRIGEAKYERKEAKCVRAIKDL